MTTKLAQLNEVTNCHIYSHKCKKSPPLHKLDFKTPELPVAML